MDTYSVIFTKFFIAYIASLPADGSVRDEKNSCTLNNSRGFEKIKYYRMLLNPLILKATLAHPAIYKQKDICNPFASFW